MNSDAEYYYNIGDVFTDEIISKLQKIKAFDRVLSRTSTMQYKDNPKPIPEIAKELNVNYIVVGSILRHGENILIRAKLIRAKHEDHLWGCTYDREWKDQFSIQAEIAVKVAEELKAVITPEEKQLIEKPPTISTTAWDFYQRGMDEHLRYWSEMDNRAFLDNAEGFYHKALDYDSTYALAYTGLALVYNDKHYLKANFSEDFLDSVLILTNKALSFDDQLAEAIDVRGVYYAGIGNRDQAIKEFDDALKINPNDATAYAWKGWLYLHNDAVQALDNYKKAAFLDRGSELDDLFRGIGASYFSAGFSEEYNFYNQEALKLDGDSMRFYMSLIRSEFYQSNYENAMEYAEKVFEIDSINIYLFFGLGLVNMYLDKYEESLKYFEKYIEIGSRRYYGSFSRSYESSYFGLVYWLNGDKEKAEYYFKKQIDRCNTLNKSGRQFEQKYFTYYNLAGVYAFRGEKDKAYKNLRLFNKRSKMYLENVFLIKNDPLFDSIRDEPKFQQIVRDVEAKYQAEHEKVRKWQEENDIL